MVFYVGETRNQIESPKFYIAFRQLRKYEYPIKPLRAEKRTFKLTSTCNRVKKPAQEILVDDAPILKRKHVVFCCSLVFGHTGKVYREGTRKSRATQIKTGVSLSTWLFIKIFKIYFLDCISGLLWGMRWTWHDYTVLRHLR